jgi:hypothetical protein
MDEIGRGVRSCIEPMGIPAGNWKLEPARFSETAEQIYYPSRYKNVEDRHLSNTCRENLKAYIVISDTKALYLLILQISCPCVLVMWRRKQFVRNCGMCGEHEKYDRILMGKLEGKGSR